MALWRVYVLILVLLDKGVRQGNSGAVNTDRSSLFPHPHHSLCAEAEQQLKDTNVVSVYDVLFCYSHKTISSSFLFQQK